jgi:biopolymer transport protein ExbD
MRFNRPEEDYYLPLTSMVDIVFLLLIFFMISTSFVEFPRRLDIQLPEARAGVPAEKVRQHLIEVGGDGRIFLNGKETTLAGLEAALEATRGEGHSAIIRADRRLPYGFVVKLMGISRAAGIYDIGIALKED